MAEIRENIMFYKRAIIVFGVLGIVDAFYTINAILRHDESTVKSGVGILCFAVICMLVSIFMKSRYAKKAERLQESFYNSLPLDNYALVSLKFSPMYNKEFFSCVVDSNLKVYAQMRPNNRVALLIVSEMDDNETCFIVHTIEMDRKKIQFEEVYPEELGGTVTMKVRKRKTETTTTE